MEEQTKTVREQLKEAEGDEEKTKSLVLEEKKLNNRRFQLISKRATQESMVQTYHDDSAKAKADLDDLQAQKRDISSKDSTLVELIAAAEEGVSTPPPTLCSHHTDLVVWQVCVWLSCPLRTEPKSRR